MDNDFKNKNAVVKLKNILILIIHIIMIDIH